MRASRVARFGNVRTPVIRTPVIAASAERQWCADAVLLSRDASPHAPRCCAFSPRCARLARRAAVLSRSCVRARASTLVSFCCPSAKSGGWPSDTAEWHARRRDAAAAVVLPAAAPPARAIAVAPAVLHCVPCPGSASRPTGLPHRHACSPSRCRHRTPLPPASESFERHAYLLLCMQHTHCHGAAGCALTGSVCGVRAAQMTDDMRTTTPAQLPRICSNNASAYPPPSLNDFRTDELREPDDCAPALWYWQMTGGTWDRQGHSYELEKKRYRRLVQPQSVRQQEAERDRRRDRSQRQRPADDHVRRREQLAAQKQRELEEEAAEAWRAGEAWRRRRALFADLLDEAGLGTLDLLKSCASHICRHSESDRTCPSMCGGMCIHTWLSDDLLEMDEARWVFELAICCTAYMELIDDNTSLRYETWLKEQFERGRVSSNLPEYTEIENTSNPRLDRFGETCEDAELALGMRLSRIFLNGGRHLKWDSLVHFHPEHAEAAMAFVIAPAHGRSDDPLSYEEAGAIRDVCDHWLEANGVSKEDITRWLA